MHPPPRAAQAEDDGSLSVQEIDAYWLQRKVSQAFGSLDASAAQTLAEQVFDALQVRGWRRRGVRMLLWVRGGGACSAQPEHV